MKTALLVFISLALALALAAPRAAFSQPTAADPRAQAKAEVEKAALHYKLGRFDEALEGYTRAYELFNAPALLFNIGQCHKNLKSYERALFFFQGYLREETDPDKRALTEELIAKTRADLEKQRLEVVPPTPPPPSLLAPREPAPAPSDLTPAAATTPDERQATPVTRKWWFWTALGVGALAIGGTIAYYGTGHTTTVPPMGSVGTLDRR